MSKGFKITIILIIIGVSLFVGYKKFYNLDEEGKCELGGGEWDWDNSCTMAEWPAGRDMPDILPGLGCTCDGVDKCWDGKRCRDVRKQK